MPEPTFNSNPDLVVWDVGFEREVEPKDCDVFIDGHYVLDGTSLEARIAVDSYRNHNALSPEEENYRNSHCDGCGAYLGIGHKDWCPNR